MTWPAAYTGILDRLDAITANARPTLCGMSACVDATVSLHASQALLEAVDPPQAAALAKTLTQRAQAGTGGELRVDWPGGPAWLDGRLPFTRDLGGTGPHAARMLAVLGAPVLLALATRSPEQLAVLHPQIWLAREGRPVPARAIVPDRPNATKVYIFEYTKDRVLGRLALPRSSRIIIRFDDSGLEDDREFASLSARLAPVAGAALLAGFSTVAGAELDASLARTRALTSRWRAGGIPAIHLELAGYERPEYRDRTLDALSGTITSVGLSRSEFDELVPGLDLARGMRALGERYALRRVCVHADGWAATATLDDPGTEREALLLGCLLASTRAAHGAPRVPVAVPAGAVFEELPALPPALGPWRFVACAAPYLAYPAATVGLGDTFTAGCLLVLGRGRGPIEPWTPSDVLAYDPSAAAPAAREHATLFGNDRRE